jgi:hypothetical protein
MIFNWFKADLLNGKGKIESAFCALQMSGTDATLFPSEGNTAVFKQDEGPGTQVQVHEFDVGETWLAIPPRFAPAIRNDGPQEFCISLVCTLGPSETKVMAPI